MPDDFSPSASIPSKAELRDVRALQQKKGRNEQHRFLVEGLKSVDELLLSDWPVAAVYATAEAMPVLQGQANARGIRCYEVNASVLASLGTLVSNDQAIAVAMMRPMHRINWAATSRVLALDHIADPGNLGTLLRLADWYGIDVVLCSPNCVDRYNPKVVSASMGSFLRVPVAVGSLPEAFAEAKSAQLALMGAVLSGDNVHAASTTMAPGVLVIGSESHGLSMDVEALLTQRLTIPRFGQAESLNAAVACGILLDHWCRRLT
ncbi:MAG: RNA methyltransferase [Moraxellaceae bacterium]|nr:RNA methyltransferase [Moraxellaceae bacterium]